MPSLKDLRNRIASVKSTQKITKAMQMVAVSKLRRAQAAVEAARPYAERVEAVLTNLGGAAPRRARPRACSSGSGADQTHLLVVCTGERGLCGAFNTSIVRLARERANALRARGQDGEDPVRRQEGLRSASPHAREADPGADRPAGRAHDRLRHGEADRRQGDRLFESGEFDVCTLFFSRFRSVISQIPTAQQLIPPELGAKNEKAPVYDYEPDEGEILTQLLPRARGRAHLSRACWKTPLRSSARR